jgi:hypothetical protein
MSDDEEDEEQEERVTAESYGALQAGDVSDECWLIRIPPKLAELWASVPEGTDLGELVFVKGGTKQGPTGKPVQVKPSLNVTVSETLVQQEQQRLAQQHHKQQQQSPSNNQKKIPPAAAIPTHYSLQAMTKKIAVMHPFTRNPKNGNIHLLGTISRTANLQVEKDDSYRAVLQDRLVATSITSQRFVKPMEATESVLTKQRHSVASSASGAGTRGFGNAVLQFGKRMLEAQQLDASSLHANNAQQGGNKKTRMFAPDQPMRSVIFALFSQQPLWTVKELKAAAVAGGAELAATKKADKEIRDLLHEIGEYHRSGDHKNMWELRHEFQQQQDASNPNNNPMQGSNPNQSQNG